MIENKNMKNFNDRKSQDKSEELLLQLDEEQLEQLKEEFVIQEYEKVEQVGLSEQEDNEIKLVGTEQVQPEQISCEQVVMPLFEKSLLGGEELKKLVDVISKSNNVLDQKITMETFVFDDKWIAEIENGIFSIEKIVKAAKSGIKEERFVVPIEKSKKITSESVRHLSSHSGYIRGFDDDGLVQPSKILNVMLEMDNGIYENRFVYTLIKKLISFVNTRLKIIEEKINTYETKHIYQNTVFKLRKSEITYNLQVNVKRKKDAGVDIEKNKELAWKINTIKSRLAILEGTEFCKSLSKLKLVTPPIMKTNAILKNVDYQNCYKLWLFISGYTELGFFIEVKDKAVDVDMDYFDDLNLLTALSVKTLIENNVIRDKLRKKIPYNDKPKRYKVQDRIKYMPDKNAEDLLDKESVINQFYFEKIRELTKKYSQSNTIIKEHKIAPDFAKFYKALASLNFKLYDEVLKLNSKIESNVSKKSILTQKRNEIKSLKEKIAKNKKLTSLMMTTVNQQLSRQNREIEKLKKQELSLQKLQENAKKERQKQLEERARISKQAKEEMQKKRALEREQRAKLLKEQSAKLAQIRKENRQKELQEQRKLKAYLKSKEVFQNAENERLEYEKIYNASRIELENIERNVLKLIDDEKVAKQNDIDTNRLKQSVQGKTNRLQNEQARLQTKLKNSSAKQQSLEKQIDTMRKMLLQKKEKSENAKAQLQEAKNALGENEVELQRANLELKRINDSFIVAKENASKLILEAESNAKKRDATKGKKQEKYSLRANKAYEIAEVASTIVSDIQAKIFEAELRVKLQSEKLELATSTVSVKTQNYELANVEQSEMQAKLQETIQMQSDIKTSIEALQIQSQNYEQEVLEHKKQLNEILKQQQTSKENLQMLAMRIAKARAERLDSKQKLSKDKKHYSNICERVKTKAEQMQSLREKVNEILLSDYENIEK